LFVIIFVCIGVLYGVSVAMDSMMSTSRFLIVQLISGVMIIGLIARQILLHARDKDAVQERLGQLLFALPLEPEDWISILEYFLVRGLGLGLISLGVVLVVGKDSGRCVSKTARTLVALSCTHIPLSFFMSSPVIEACTAEAWVCAGALALLVKPAGLFLFTVATMAIIEWGMEPIFGHS
jgi:hypothetical protein